MNFSLILIALNLTLACGISILSAKKILKEWPKISIVIALNNFLILVVYYSSFAGYSYYLLNALKTVPLVILLVHLAQTDPSPNWSYRAVCWVMIIETFTYGINLLMDLRFGYYDQMSLITSLLELFVLALGGLNVQFTLATGFNHNPHNIKNCSSWARSHLAHRE